MVDYQTKSFLYECLHMEHGFKLGTRLLVKRNGNYEPATITKQNTCYPEQRWYTVTFDQPDYSAMGYPEFPDNAWIKMLTEAEIMAKCLPMST